MSPYVWDLFQACSTRAEIEWLYWNSFSYGDRSLGISDVCIFAVLARSTAPLLLLPSVLQPVSAPATPEGPTDAQVVQSRRFHLHHKCQ